LVQLAFCKEYATASLKVGIPEEEKKVTYDQMRQILEELYFSKPIQEPGVENENTKLVGEFWKELAGSESGKDIESNKLLLYLAAIILIQLLNLEGAQPLSVDDIQRIHKKYSLFFLNRKSGKPQKKQPAESGLGHSFKPSICEKSIQLAETGRDKEAKTEEKKQGSPNPKSDEEPSKSHGLVALADSLIQKKRNQEEYLYNLI